MSDKNQSMSVEELIAFLDGRMANGGGAVKPKFEDGKMVMYLHSAVRGKKLEMIQANSKVFFEIDCDRMPFEGRVPCQYGMVYSSIMGRGTATLVEDPEAKMQAMSILMKTQTGKDFSFNERLVSIVAVIRIDVTEYTAKHRPLPEAMR